MIVDHHLDLALALVGQHGGAGARLGDVERAVAVLARGRGVAAQGAVAVSGDARAAARASRRVQAAGMRARPWRDPQSRRRQVANSVRWTLPGGVAQAGEEAAKAAMHGFGQIRIGQQPGRAVQRRQEAQAAGEDDDPEAAEAGGAAAGAADPVLEGAQGGRGVGAGEGAEQAFPEAGMGEAAEVAVTRCRGCRRRRGRARQGWPEAAIQKIASMRGRASRSGRPGRSWTRTKGRSASHSASESGCQGRGSE